jgi:hypothetical protein
MTQIFAQDSRHILGHIHSLLFEGFSHTPAAAINSWADADFRHGTDQPVFRWVNLI